MCLYTFATDRWIADRDIICFKVLDKNLCSPYLNKKYELNKTYKEKIDFKPTDAGLVTTTGLYTYTNLVISDYFKTNFLSNKNLDCYEAIIPKGSEYITDGQEYCSNTLTVICKLRHPILIKPIYYYYKLRNKISNLFK